MKVFTIGQTALESIRYRRWIVGEPLPGTPEGRVQNRNRLGTAPIVLTAEFSAAVGEITQARVAQGQCRAIPACF